MNVKTWIPLVFAVVLALIAAKLTHNVIAGKKSASGSGSGEFVQVVVARGDLAPGTELTAENTTLAPMPGNQPPASTFTRTEDLLGRVATAPLFQGQPVNEKLLAPKGAGSGLQAMVPTGMRAVTIEINEFTGLAGMVSPGMNVDVVSTFRDDATRETVTRTVVQNLKVLAVGPRMIPPAGEEQKEMYKSVTLLATPRDAERVELATYTGRPRLALRSGRDFAAVATKGTNLSDLIGNTAAVAPGSTLLTSFFDAMKKAQGKSPATQPAGTVVAIETAKTPEVDPFDAPRTQQRTVEIIRNGNKSTVIFQEPVLPNTQDASLHPMSKAD